MRLILLRPAVSTVRRSVLVTLVLVALGFSSLTLAAALEPLPTRVIGVDSSVHAYQIVSLNPEHFRAGSQVIVPVGGRSLSVLLRDSDIMAPGVQKANPGVRALRGSMQGFPSGDARFTATNTTLRGSVGIDGQLFFIEPAQLRTMGGMQSIEIAYSAMDVTLPPTFASDTVPNPAGGEQARMRYSMLSRPLAPLPPTAEKPAGNTTTDGRPGGTPSSQTELMVQSAAGHHGNSSHPGGSDPLYYMIRFGIYADTDYCNYYSDWPSRLISLLNSVSGIYIGQESTQIQLYDGPKCISGSGSWSSDASILLSQFASWCDSDSVCHTMSDTHMATGKSLTPSGTMGIAEEPGTHSLSQQTSSTDYEKVHDAAHEIGHNFNGDHGDATSWYGYDCSIFGNTEYSLMWSDYEGDCVSRNTFSSINQKAVKANIMSKRTDWFPYTAQSSTSSDGFYVTSWWIRHPSIPGVGSTIDLNFIFWTGGQTVTINIFIGCRNGPGQGTNCDFGYTGNIIVNGNTGYSYSAKSLGVTGVWQVWPAYYYNGHYGPYQWSMVQVPVTNAVIASYAGPDTSNNVQLRNFNARAPASTVHVGDTLVFDFTYTNVGSSNLNFDPYGIFTAARDPSNNNKDFFQTVCLLRPYLGRVTHWIGWITVTTSGTWTFWPAYYLNGFGWGPPGWHQFSITVYT